ncbi:hypothetical protein GCM10011583_12140 [Streptomyces camponoticapitis]|uniref:Uncharacterized protein n=1 Tax=Streptomyces camponoticapitis TaxID=1616125 RepID=A0ABQ2E0N7_9ACTN|nr:hypothetical protein GCM10011583_12140 [Streptomyces camponoticapitis]
MLWLADGGASLALLVKVEAGRELLEYVAVVLPLSDDRPEHGGEGVPRDPEPVRPSPILASLVHKAFADVENDCSNHATIV